jgi:hypothetical protein
MTTENSEVPLLLLDSSGDRRLVPCTVLLLFSGHRDPPSMTTFAASQAEYQASQNQP